MRLALLALLAVLLGTLGCSRYEFVTNDEIATGAGSPFVYRVDKLTGEVCRLEPYNLYEVSCGMPGEKYGETR